VEKRVGRSCFAHGGGATQDVSCSAHGGGATRDTPVAGFNLVAVAEGEGLCLHWDGSLRATSFGAGAHVISSNYDLDDAEMPEKAVFDAWLARGEATEPRLVEFLSSHDGTRPVCKHGTEFGTVSSTLYVESTGRLLHADGPPCRTAFAECASLAEILR